MNNPQNDNQNDNNLLNQNNNFDTLNVSSNSENVANQPVQSAVEIAPVAQQPVVDNSQPLTTQQPAVSAVPVQQPVMVTNQTVGLTEPAVNQPVVDTSAVPTEPVVSQPVVDTSIGTNQPVQPLLNNNADFSQAAPVAQTPNVLQQNSFGTGQDMVQPTFSNVNPQMQQPMNQNVNNQNTTNNSNKGNIIFIIIVVVLVGAIVTLGVLYFTGKIGGKSSGDSSSSSSNSSSSNNNSSNNNSNSSENNNNNGNSNDNSETFEISGVTMTIPDGYKLTNNGNNTVILRGKYNIVLGFAKYEDPLSFKEDMQTTLTEKGYTVSSLMEKNIDGVTLYVTEGSSSAGNSALGVVPLNNNDKIICYFTVNLADDLSGSYSVIAKMIKNAKYNSNNNSSSNSNTFEIDGITMNIPSGYKYDSTNEALISNDNKYTINIGFVESEDPKSFLEEMKKLLIEKGYTTGNIDVKSIDGTNVNVVEGKFGNQIVSFGAILSKDSSILAAFCVKGVSDVSAIYSIALKTIKTASYSNAQVKSFSSQSFNSKFSLSLISGNYFEGLL